MNLDRTEMARAICDRLDSRRQDICRQWESSAPIRHFVVDDVLPAQWADRIRAAFPEEHEMTLRRSLREKKYVAAQMNRYDSLLEESIFAFQAPGVLDRVGELTQIRALDPDQMLYAGGISLMSRGHFLNPHIDNSHDKSRQRYRMLNLLYYVSPQWPEDQGGNLELWQTGPTGRPTTIASRFNRLVVMLTGPNSWHSVSKNLTRSNRCCVSNYYFSSRSIDGRDYYHVTSYRGRPEEPFRDAALRADNWLRTVIRTRFPRAFTNPHFYDRQTADQRSDADAAATKQSRKKDG